MLAKLDTNGDGWVGAGDGAFSSLRFWRDANGDGDTDAGELLGLAQAGVRRISIETQPSDVDIEGNLVPLLGTFQRTDGGQGIAADVLLSVDTFLGRFDPRSTFAAGFVPTTTALMLPNLRGFGRVPDLYVAMSRDPGLAKLVIQAAALTVDRTAWTGSTLRPCEEAMVARRSRLRISSSRKSARTPSYSTGLDKALNRFMIVIPPLAKKESRHAVGFLQRPIQPVIPAHRPHGFKA